EPKALEGGRIEKGPRARLARRVGDRVHDDVELAPLALEEPERRIALTVDGHIEREREARAERVREGLDPLLHLVVEVGECELGALAVHRLGDTPGDRAIGRDPDDEGALAGEKSHGFIPPGGDYAGRGAAAAALRFYVASAGGCGAFVRRGAPYSMSGRLTT